jgi:processive 1,2-diacylglycerol beta-glucosyltransferase
MGHLRAATALGRAFEAIPGTHVQVEDTLRYARAAFRGIYSDMYLRVAERAPTLWSQFYSWTDYPPTPLSFVAAMRALGTTLGVRGLPRLLQQAQPDAIICTHFLPLEVLAPLRYAGVPPLYAVVTDYRAHHFWAIDGVNRYFVPTRETEEQLVAAGVPRPHITVTGIPIDPAIQQPVAPMARQTLGLLPHRPVVLVNGGGLAAERVRAIVLEVLAQRLPMTLLVAAGRNRALEAALAGVSGTETTTLRVLGPQPSLDPLIAVSDLVVGKAGGLTVSETLARGVPMVIVAPVAGQEEWNAEYVVRAGAGECHATADRVARTIAALLLDQRRRAAMAAAAKQAGRPAAAQTIALHVLADIEHLPSPVWHQASSTLAQMPG